MNKEERIEQLRRRGLIVATTALGAGVAMIVGVSQKTDANINNKKEEKKVETTTRNTTNEPIDEQEEKTIIDEIMEEYNAKSDTKISIEDVGIKSRPSYLIERKNEDGTIEYIQKYNSNGKELAPNEQYIYTDDKGENGMKGNFESYVVVNREDNTIICEMGKAYCEMLDNFTTESVMVNNTEYLDGSVEIEFNFEDKEDKEKAYKDLEEEFEINIKNKENAKENEEETR